MKRTIVLLMLCCVAIMAQAQSREVFYSSVTVGNQSTDPGKSFGSTMVDVNNDGFDDIFVCNSYETEANRLYYNQGDGTFVADDSFFPNDMVQSLSATWGDYDNDGLLDLFVANGANPGLPLSANYLYHNEGNGVFTKITTGDIVTEQGWSIDASWADYDNDGWLDLFVSNFDSSNFLYHNNGDGSFTKITDGAIVTENWASMGCSWGDYDNDGYLDLFVANNFLSTTPAHNNNLYHNNGDGTFTKITTGEIVNDQAESHGCSWGDFNNDGYLDLFVANHDWNINKKDFLFQNNGDGTFTRIYDPAIESEEMSTMASAWVDVNLDGYLDLYISHTNSGERQNSLFINNGNGSFTKNIDDPSTIDEFRSRSVCVGDVNADGYPDLYSASYSTSHNNGFYLHNGSTNNWIAFTLTGDASNTAALGAKVAITAGGLTQIREVSGQTGTYSQSSLTQLFGIGTNSEITEATIYWPSGLVQPLQNLTINQVHAVNEGNSAPSVSLPVAEDFESGSLPAGWSIEYVSGTVDWTFQEGGHIGSPATAHGGVYNALFYGGSYNGNTSYLVSPVINASGAQNLTLSFWHAQAAWVGDQDSLKVLYRLSGTDPWMEIAQYGESVTDWVERSLAIPQVSSTMQIAFVGIDGYGYGVCIDDILLDGDVIVTNPPQNLAVTDMGEASWDAPATDDLVGYNVYLDGSFIELVTATTYQYTNLTGGTTYTAGVSALYDDGESTIVTANFTYPMPGFDPPQNLAVTELGFATWEAPQTGGGANEFFDDFESGLGNWNVINNGGVGEWMIYGDPYPNSYTMPPASSGNVCAADADEAGSGSTTDTDLVLAAPMDLSGLTTVILEFDSDFNALDADDHCYVDVSNDGGTNWENVLSYLGDDVRETHETIDISAQAAGSSNVLLRFRSVQPGWDWFWVIDNVAVHGPAADNTRDLVGYNVYLDGTFIEMVTALEYQYTGLEAGTTYTAGISALYDDGESDIVTADFTYPTPQTNPPENLVADINDYNDVTLNWDQPGGTGGLLAYHTGYDANGIGTGAAVDFSCAARFTAAELADYYGNAITNARVVIHSADFSSVLIKVWEGGSYGDPGTEVYSADVTGDVIVADWTEHTLSTPVTLVDGNEYWIGYAISATGDHPAAVDAGPMYPDKGAWMYFNDAWQTLPELGATLDFNWCIEGVVGPATAAANTAVVSKVTKPSVSTLGMTLKPDHERTIGHASAVETTRALTGYKVYRDGAMISEITDPTITTYSDMSLDAGSYAYHVTAVYDDGESEPSNTENVTIVLPAPAGFNAVSQGPAQSTIMCTWSAPAATRNLSEYKIYRDGTEIGSTTGLFYADLDVPSGEYTYHVTAIYSDTYESDASNAVTLQHTDAPTPLVPTVTALNGNYPNPFNPTTEVKFSLNEAAEVNIIVYNIKGEKVKTLVNGHMEAAFHTVTWNGDDENGASVGSGVFFYRMATPGYTEVKKMILLK